MWSIPFNHGNKRHPKELLLKYCLLRAGRWLGAKIKEQKRKIYLKTTQPQTVELRKSLEMVPRCQWEPRNHRAFVSWRTYCIRQMRVPDTLKDTNMGMGLWAGWFKACLCFILAGRAWESILRQPLHQFSLSLQNWFFSFFFFSCKILFDVDHFLNSWLNLLTILFLFYVLVFWPWGMWALSSPNHGLNACLLHWKAKS